MKDRIVAEAMRRKGLLVLLQVLCLLRFLSAERTMTCICDAGSLNKRWTVKIEENKTILRKRGLTNHLSEKKKSIIESMLEGRSEFSTISMEGSVAELFSPFSEDFAMQILSMPLDTGKLVFKYFSLGLEKAGSVNKEEETAPCPMQEKKAALTIERSTQGALEAIIRVVHLEYKIHILYIRDIECLYNLQFLDQYKWECLNEMHIINCYFVNVFLEHGLTSLIGKINLSQSNISYRNNTSEKASNSSKCAIKKSPYVSSHSDKKSKYMEKESPSLKQKNVWNFWGLSHESQKDREAVHLYRILKKFLDIFVKHEENYMSPDAKYEDCSKFFCIKEIFVVDLYFQNLNKDIYIIGSSDKSVNIVFWIDGVCKNGKEKFKNERQEFLYAIRHSVLKIHCKVLVVDSFHDEKDSSPSLDMEMLYVLLHKIVLDKDGYIRFNSLQKVVEPVEEWSNYFKRDDDAIKKYSKMVRSRIIEYNLIKKEINKIVFEACAEIVIAIIAEALSLVTMSIFSIVIESCPLKNLIALRTCFRLAAEKSETSEKEFKLQLFYLPELVRVDISSISVSMSVMAVGIWNLSMIKTTKTPEKTKWRIIDNVELEYIVNQQNKPSTLYWISRNKINEQVGG